MDLKIEQLHQYTYLINTNLPGTSPSNPIEDFLVSVDKLEERLLLRDLNSYRKSNKIL